LSADLVIAIHDEVLNPGDLRGLAGDKSLEGALARVENRLVYGMIADAFDLAAAYAAAVAQGHCFNDGNKRTAFRVMNAALRLNGVEVRWAAVEAAAIGDRIIALAQRRLDDADLAAWLRAL
jgi:death-on-curing protein